MGNLPVQSGKKRSLCHWRHDGRAAKERGLTMLIILTNLRHYSTCMSWA